MRVLGGVLLLGLVLGCGGRLVATPDERAEYLRYVAFEAPDHTHVLLRWPKRKMPIKVFLPPAPAALFPNREEVTRTTREAVLAWTDVAGPGVPSFVFVDEAGGADIPVNWAEQSPSRSVAHVMFDVNLFQRRFGVANLLVTGRYRDGRLATAEDLRLVVLHEMGHALGLGGHSPNPDDVMYGFLALEVTDETPEPDEADDGEPVVGEIARGTAHSLSERDRATLTKLYSLPIGKRIGGARRAY